MSLNCFRELKRKIEFLSIAKKVMLLFVSPLLYRKRFAFTYKNVGRMGTVKIVRGNSNKTSFEYDIKKGDVDK